MSHFVFVNFSLVLKGQKGKNGERGMATDIPNFLSSRIRVGKQTAIDDDDYFVGCGKNLYTQNISIIYKNIQKYYIENLNDI